MMAKSLYGVLIVSFVGLSAVNADDSLNPHDPLLDDSPEEFEQTADARFGFRSWPGGDTPVRGSVELATAPLSGYGLALRSPFREDQPRGFVRFALPLSEEDDGKHGKLDIQVFPTVADAQLRLAENLMLSNSAVPAPRLTLVEFPAADVAFGGIYRPRPREDGLVLGDLWSVTYTRGNVFITFKAPVSVGLELATKLDADIQRAPIWKAGDPKPSLVLSQEAIDFFLIDPASAVEENELVGLPFKYHLHQNTPNPFNPETTIRYEVPTGGLVQLNIYNLGGQKVACLVDQVQMAGSYTITWDGRDNAGQELATGIYLYSLHAGTRIEARRLLLLR